MDKIVVKLEPRTITGKHVKHLRAQGLVPASICGKSVQSENFVTDARLFTKIYQRAGRSGLLELQTPKGVLNGFIRQIQRHPISGQWLHVDFHVVDMNISMTADVPVAAFGDNDLLKDGVINITHPTLHVRGLPADLPQSIEIDISSITEYGAPIHVSDLKLPANVEVLTPETEALVVINRAVIDAADLGATEPADTEDGKETTDAENATEGDAEESTPEAE